MGPISCLNERAKATVLPDHWHEGKIETECTDGAEPAPREPADDHTPTMSYFSDLGKRRLEVLEGSMKDEHYTGTGVYERFLRGWYARMVDNTVRFGEMLFCFGCATAGVSCLAVGSWQRSWAWAFSVEVVGSLAHIERGGGHLGKKTLLDGLHLFAVFLAWAVVVGVNGIDHVADKVLLILHLFIHIFLRSFLPFILVTLKNPRRRSVLGAFVAFEPEVVRGFLKNSKHGDLLPSKGPEYKVKFTEHPGPDERCTCSDQGKLCEKLCEARQWVNKLVGGEEVRKRCHRYIEYRSETGWFKSVGGMNEANTEELFKHSAVISSRCSTGGRGTGFYMGSFHEEQDVRC